ncbi:hypothetical protein MMMDOFMJ_2948 [Methylobacterium gnaphalii]|nr:hypothetical protein MMMDOFMJ_2948 [Methylobacterium gnaphalii]
MKSAFAASAVALLMSASLGVAAPCNIGAAKGNAPQDAASEQKSSATDQSNKNTARG